MKIGLAIATYLFAVIVVGSCFSIIFSMWLVLGEANASRARPGEMGMELAFGASVVDNRRTNILVGLGHVLIEMEEPHAQTLTGTFISVTGQRVVMQPDGGGPTISAGLDRIHAVTAIP